MIVETKEQDETLSNCCFSIKENYPMMGMQSSVSSIELLNDSLADNSLLISELRKQLENAHHQIVLLQREYEIHLLQVHHQHEIELLKKDHTIELLQRDLEYHSGIRKVPTTSEIDQIKNDDYSNQSDDDNSRTIAKDGIDELTQDIVTLQQHIHKLLKNE